MLPLAVYVLHTAGRCEKAKESFELLPECQEAEIEWTDCRQCA